MPVEIKEMVIRANIRDPEEERRNGKIFPSTDLTDEDRTAIIIEQCVEQVLEILKREQER